MLKSRLVFALPAVLSATLSVATLGSTVGWQDSGYFLSGIKELGILYPPGFVLHLLLCKVWTLLLFFLDFTVSVHLFSAVCAALAAGVMAVAVRDMIRSRGPLLGVGAPETEPHAEGVAMVAGCLLACGYTFWASALLSKGYSFYYLILSLLLHRMIRADETQRPRDFTILAVLIGLSWQAHPSATLAGAAFAVFVFLRGRFLGWKGVLWRAGVAALAALGPALLLPALAAGNPALAFGDPRTVSSFFEYLTGQRFVSRTGAFGWEPSRVQSVGRYFWEEYLGIGGLAIALGLASLFRARRRMLFFLLAWIVPFTAITVLFRIEGQHDHWFVAAWLPLTLVLGVGLAEAARRANGRGGLVLAAAGVLGVGWAAWANGADVKMRGYRLAEMYGRIHLDSLDTKAILLLGSDDAAAITHYLQIVKGVRTDVTLVRQSHLSPGGDSWYERGLMRRDPSLLRALPPAATLPGSLAPAVGFANANVSPGRPVFFEIPPPGTGVRSDYRLVPAGSLWKMVPRDSADVDPRYWQLPVDPASVKQSYRRARGQAVMPAPGGGVVFRPEPYERRLLVLLQRALKNLADWHQGRGSYAASRDLYESILQTDPEAGDLPEVVYPLATAYLALGSFDRAEPLFRRTLELEGAEPRTRAGALAYLGEISRRAGREAEARRHFEEAARVPGLDRAFREEIERRARP